MITTHAAKTPIHTILPSRSVGREKRSASRRMPHGRRVATRPAKTAPTGSAPRHPAPAHAFHRTAHLPHQALHAAAGKLAHHLFHLGVLLQQAIDVGRLGTGTARDARATRTVQKVG